MDAKTIIDQTEKYYLPVFGRYQLALTHGKGCKLYDADGNEYLDFLAGIAVNSLGHAHPALVKAISEQAAKLMHCSNIYYTDIQAKAVKEIIETTGFDRVFLANSGAEANEGAIKLARKYGHQKNEGKYRIITAVHSFHGRTMMTVTATGQPKYQQGYEPLPAGFDYVPYGDLEALREAMDEDVCCVLLEPIQGEGGVHVPSDTYLHEARLLCDKYDALLVFDEIQTGVARTGKWFAYMHSGVKPDIMTSAKALGCGVPVGAFAATKEVADAMCPGDHGTTYGGNPLATAAVCKVFEIFEKDGILNHVNEIAPYLKDKLNVLKDKFPDKIKDVRGKGLMMGMELYGPAGDVVSKLLKKGVILISAGTNIIRFVPPLVVEKEHIDVMCEKLEEVFSTNE